MRRDAEMASHRDALQERRRAAELAPPFGSLNSRAGQRLGGQHGANHVERGSTTGVGAELLLAVGRLGHRLDRIGTEIAGFIAGQ